MAGKTDFGPPNYKDMLPPVILENYGQWKYHENVKPGVLKHVAESGDELYTVRVGSGRLVSTDWIRDVCDIAEKFCGSHLRFTSRHNLEFLVSDKNQVEPLINLLKEQGYAVGGTGHASATRSTPRAGSIAIRPRPMRPGSSRRRWMISTSISRTRNCRLIAAFRWPAALTCAALCIALTLPFWVSIANRQRLIMILCAPSAKFPM